MRNRHFTLLKKITGDSGIFSPGGTLRTVRDRKSRRKEADTSEANMNRAAPMTRDDEDLIDTLIAISVVAKRLASKLQKELTKEGDKDGENE